ncbi:MAG: arginase [Gemmatimonadetes bacterium]|nr:arginase [Gemmatimonadota bacterium]MYA64281.1 arginase [Gemmatimonadota bacterium]MYB97432.1 arginase [Gemmatimonadota bacterium]MYH53209.1 arginase [Gemmatimonadota bacterium]MYI45366.1 arginase [Gemmatimonadota bacterium]
MRTVASKEATARDIALVSVSIDLGAGRRGVDMGPSALRIAGITRELESIGHRVKEFGTITAGGLETTEAGESPLRFLDEIDKVVGHTREAVRAGLDGGCFPLVLGGDHSLSIGSVAAVAEHYRQQDRSIGVIWVDAHADMNRPETTPSGNIHGMSLAVLLGRGHPRLTHRVPSVRPENASVLGARELDAGEKRLISELGVRVFTMSEIDERGVATCMDEALRRASAGTAGFHLSLDLDALDPRVAPGVGTPVQGGLTYREGHLVCEKAARSGRLLSLEVVELNPVLDDRNHTAALAVGLVASALGKTIL